jgi:hypothetical protein
MIRTRMLSATIALCVASCATPTLDLSSRLTPDTLVNATSVELCEDFYRSRSKATLAELDKRHMLSAKDREALSTLRSVIGMTDIAAGCLYGNPRAINDTTTARGRSEQWVYCAGFMYFAKMRDLGKPSLFSTPETERMACEGDAYLYFENGILTATQNVPPLPQWLCVESRTEPSRVTGSC